MIPMQTIEGSTQVKAAGFDPAQGVIRVQFHSGHSYDYPGGTQEVFDGLMAAESKGKFFNTAIRPLMGVKVDPDKDTETA